MRSSFYKCTMLASLNKLYEECSLVIKTDKKKRFFKVVLFGLITGAIYGPIAAYANWEHGIWVATKVGLFQALLCFISTTYSTSLMLTFFDRPKNLIHKFLLASFGTGLINLTALVVLHIISNTPNLAATILPPIILAGPYYIIFPLILTLRLKKELQVVTPF